VRQEVCSIILFLSQVLTLVDLQRTIFLKTFFLFIPNFYKFIWELNAYLYILLLAKKLDNHVFGESENAVYNELKVML